jgi:hypothetical protein
VSGLTRNEELAKLIFSLGQYEGYSTSLMQTEKNLSSKPNEQKFEKPDDKYIFEDLVRAIDYATTQSKVTVDVIKGINASMNSGGHGQPEHPGVLRNDVEIHVGDYIPKATVTEAMLQKRIDGIHSDTASDSWKMYAELAKLQPFDNGNKRTALIAANLNYGAFASNNKNFLIIPTDFRRMQFDTNLFYFYMADDWDDHMPDEQESLQTFIDFALNSNKNG